MGALFISYFSMKNPAQYACFRICVFLPKQILLTLGRLCCDMKRQLCFCRAQSLARKLQILLEEYVPFPATETQEFGNVSEDGCFALGLAFESERERRSSAPSPETRSADDSEDELEDSGSTITMFVPRQQCRFFFAYANYQAKVFTVDRRRNQSRRESRKRRLSASHSMHL
jgi:hypothetical protein